jgi:autotransporter-associated beta strand protein
MLPKFKPGLPYFVTESQFYKSMKTPVKRFFTYLIATSALLLGGISAQAASQTWTNAPVDQTWLNTNNWVGQHFPGAINNVSPAVNSDVATFNTPIPGSTIGGAAAPIKIGDATTLNRGLQISGITFDTANCGAYVFQTNMPNSFPSNGCLFVTHNGSITMNPTVTSSETFLVPVYIVLPNSTAGAYHFVNNSTTPSATMYFAAVTNNSASTRGTVFTLDGSNTGTNTIQFLSRGTTLNGAYGFIKQGTGTWILPNASDFTNANGNTVTVNINDGTLIVQNSGCWGLAPNIIINSNAVEQLVNANETNTTMNGGTLQEVSGTGYVSSLAVGAAVNVSAHLMATGPGDLIVLGTNTTATGGSATSVIHLNGSGTVLLLTNSTYIGGWSVDSGTLQIGIGATSALGTGPNVNVAAGGILDLTTMGAGVTFNPTTAGISGSGAGTTVGSTAATIKPDAAGTLDLATGNKNISLTFAPTLFAGDTTHPALYISQGTLALGGNLFTVNNVSGTPLGAGTYTLIQAAGSITSTGNLAANVTGSGLQAGTVGTIQISGGSVNLVVVVYVPKHLAWQGGNPNENWDVNTTPNWFNGAASSVFNNADTVVFNSAGASNPAVNLVGALIPGSIVVDTTATNYLFGGSGAISGSASLTKMGAGTLIISNMNDYIGGTVVSNGTLQLGKVNGFSGSSDMTISNNATVDLNANSSAIGALNGNGTVDTVSGGAVVLTIGNNADSGTFSGTIKNTAGALGVAKANTGTETLAGANTYAGGTTVNAGVLRVANPAALGTGGVTNNLGTVLDVSTNIVVGSITGVGTVENNSTATINQLDILGTSAINGLIADGSGGMSVLVSGGTTTFTLAGTYSGGTIVASGATLAVQNVAPSPNPGTGGIILSNNATLSLPGTGNNAANVGNTMTTVAGAEATFRSGTTANNYSGQFVGGITSTDLFFGGSMSIGGTMSFTNFLGTVIVTNGGIRGFTGTQGGPNTSFDFIGGGAWVARDGASTIHFGSLSGDPTANINGAGGNGVNLHLLCNYIVGEANANSTYSGGISGSNSLVKVGTGTLVLNGGSFLFTNVFLDGLFTITNISYGSNMMLFVGNTTISNGVLALVAPTLLTNSTAITLAGATAVLDGTAMGYISNEFDSDGVTITNSFPVTNSIFELLGVDPGTLGPQTMGGVGTLKAILLADQGSILTPGLPTGVFNVTSNATLSGAVTMDLDTTNAAANSELTANSFTINGTATLTVTNIGPGIINGTTFQLFNHPVSGFGSVTLPAKDPTGTTNYIWKNFLAVDGSITLTNGGVVPVSAKPAKFTGISVNGLALTITATNGAANGTYRLLESTNLLVPVSLWTPVFTNSFDGSGNLNVTTNVVNPARPQMYYLLLMP